MTRADLVERSLMELYRQVRRARRKRGQPEDDPTPLSEPWPRSAMVKSCRRTPAGRRRPELSRERGVRPEKNVRRGRGQPIRPRWDVIGRKILAEPAWVRVALQPGAFIG